MYLCNSAIHCKTGRLVIQTLSRCQNVQFGKVYLETCLWSQKVNMEFKETLDLKNASADKPDCCDKWDVIKRITL